MNNIGSRTFLGRLFERLFGHQGRFKSGRREKTANTIADIEKYL
jgi:hypothetical protein